MDLQRYSRESLQRTEMFSFLKKDYQHYSWSLRTLDRRLQYFGVRFIDRNVTVEHVRRVVQEEFSRVGNVT